MSVSDLSALAKRLAIAHTITSADVLALRRAVYGDEAVSLMEAEVLLRLEAALRAPSIEWSQFFIEALTDILVNQVEPAGYITAEQAQWLSAQTLVNGVYRSPLVLSAVVHILERARSAPRDLVINVLKTIRLSIERRGGSIVEEEVELLRRAVFAGGGIDGLAVSREEAELLFDIDGALTGIASSWPDFFARAIGNHLMYVSIHAIPSAAEALRRQRVLEQQHETDVGGFLRAVVNGFNKDLSFKMPSAEEDFRKDNEADAAALQEAAALTAVEVAWIAERLARDGKLSPGEDRLKQFLLEERSTLPPALDQAFAKLAA